jgi:hypothetical protein
MEESRKKAYAELLAAMSIDYLGGGISWETLVANLSSWLSLIKAMGRR